MALGKEGGDRVGEEYPSQCRRLFLLTLTEQAFGHKQVEPIGGGPFGQAETALLPRRRLTPWDFKSNS